MQSRSLDVPPFPIQRPSIARQALVSALLLALPTVASAQASCSTQLLSSGGVRGTDGIVNATCMWDPDGSGPLTPLVVVGGQFTVAGTALATCVATYDPASGVWAGMGNGPWNAVSALATMPNGDLVAAHDFQIDRWNGSTWSSVGGVYGTVNALLTLPNGDLVAGGDFTSVGGVTAYNVARWDGASWVPMSGPAGGPVHCLAVMPNGDVIAGGAFTSAGGVAAASVARWNGTTWSAMGFPGSQFTQNVFCLAVLPSGNLVAGGDFATASGLNGIAQWNGLTWSAMGSGMNGAVYGLRLRANGELVAVGGFSSAGVTANRIARWNGTSWLAIGSGLSALVAVRTVEEIANGDLVAGGGIAISGNPDNYIQRWNGTNWSTMGNGFNNSVHAACALPNGDLVVGGKFTGAGAVSANRIARWNGATWAPMGNGMSSNSVKALAALPNGDIVAAGDFVSAGASGTLRIARWNGTSWSAMGTGLNGTVNVLLTMPNGDLIAGGAFTAAGSVAASYIARWNGATWSPVGTGPGSPVWDLTSMANGDIVAASGSGVTRWNGVTWTSVGGVNPAVDYVSAVLGLPNGDLVVAGAFTFTSNIARWTGQGWVPMAAGMGGVPAVTDLFLLPDGDLVACGGIALSTGITGAARWNGAGWSALLGSYSGLVNCVAMTKTELAFGGEFKVVGGTVSPYLVRLATTCPAAATPSGAGCNSSVGPMSLTADALPWIGGTFRSTCTGIAPQSISFALLGFTSPAIPLSSLHPSGGVGCDLLANQDATMLLVPSGGQVTSQFGLAMSPVFVGVVLHHQVVQIELDSSLQILQIAGSNGLALTMGSF